MSPVLKLFSRKDCKGLMQRSQNKYILLSLCLFCDSFVSRKFSGFREPCSLFKSDSNI